ncbi:hypothetical protein AVEN_83095-1 [Araneus ventricosus]|uniref:Uncharacterized protein n=1 Tax=Araneus ventricosus TaxID=182803 RepID=A0A4Y2ANC4_ARAVE|nr:hypothetical protein AVEN_83095-1 [Araneus ventricosus]
MLYYSAEVSGPQSLLKVVSPVFEPHTLPTCAIQFALHMFHMDFAKFKMVINAPNNSWESTTFEGNSAHRTEPVLGAAIRVEQKRFRRKTRVNTVTRYYGTMRRFAGETGAASLGKDETRATRTGYTSLPRQCEQRH